MAIALSVAGMSVKYCAETTAGSRPSAGYVTIPGVKSIPEFGGDPNTLDASTLANLKYKTYIKGLQDPGGSIGLTVNDSDAFRTAWTTLMTAYAGLTGGKQIWFEFAYPSGSGIDSFYFTAEPVEISFGGADVDSVLENTAYIIPTGEPVWATAST